MFGAKNDLGFTEDDLDLTPETARRRSVIAQVDRATRYFHMAMVISIAPMVFALLVQAIRSDLPNRWTTFWIVMAILGAVAVTLEVGIVRKQRREAYRSVETE